MWYPEHGFDIGGEHAAGNGTPTHSSIPTPKKVAKLGGVRGIGHPKVAKYKGTFDIGPGGVQA